ncbi:ABC transporter permease [Microlunatus elymi]|uniref:ABC transporter permease n=1 Tax=Microlunatus elymi TaxID=2596828 RepID=UPI001D19329E|nr:ABC transporter permease [Microlunatus elymi]
MTASQPGLAQPLPAEAGEPSDAKTATAGRARKNPLRFLSRRFGFYVFTAWAAITLNFLIPRFVPGDPAQDLLNNLQQQTGQTPTPDQIAAIHTFYGDPTENLFGQYLQYWADIARFRFGTSLSEFPTPVSELVGQALPWTVLLVGVTTIFAWVIGTFLGAWIGTRPGSRVDTIFTPVTTFLHSVPPFWLALLALWLFGFVLGWFPLAGGYDPSVPFQLNNIWFLLSVLKYGALPAFTLIFVGFNGWFFSMRNVMVTTVAEDYVLLARAKGLSSRRVLFKYSARNALLPNVTGLALSIGGVISGVLLTEIVFTYPGMGYLLLKAIGAHDFPVMQTVFLMITLTTLAANFLADSLYVLLDPRTRESN